MGHMWAHITNIFGMLAHVDDSDDDQEGNVLVVTLALMIHDVQMCTALEDLPAITNDFLFHPVWRRAVTHDEC